jgi:threonine synthase
MDIQVASNFERALFEAANRDADWTAHAMDGFARDRRLVLPKMVRDNLRARYAAARCDDVETLETIARCRAETGRLIDPHTAVALNTAWRLNHKAGAPVVVLSTAHPAKFPDAVAKATGAPPPVPHRLEGLFALPERCEILANDKALVRAHIESKLSR